MQAGAGAGAAACVQSGQSAASHTVQGSRLRQGKDPTIMAVSSLNKRLNKVSPLKP